MAHAASHTPAWIDLGSRPSGSQFFERADASHIRHRVVIGTNANGQTAQNNAANAAKLQKTVDLANGSDNLLLSQFIDPALGCTP